MEVLSSKFDQMNPRIDDFDFDNEWQSKLYKRQNISKNQEDDLFSYSICFICYLNDNFTSLPVKMHQCTAEF